MAIEKKLELKAAKATLFFKGEFFGNIHKVEARNVETWRGPYAQYASAAFAEFVPKGKRNARRLTQTSYPSLVILEGWGHDLTPDSLLGAPKVTGEGLEVSEGRYSGHDPRWESDFAAQLEAYLAANPAVKVLVDYRKLNAHQPLNQAA